jgi:hypothetical protein
MGMELDNMSCCESESPQDCVFLCQSELAALHNDEWAGLLSAGPATQLR